MVHAKRALIVAALVATWTVPTTHGQCAQGDPDGSGVVDLQDYDAFVDCVTGPAGGPVQAGCGSLDFDADGDVDLLDFGRLQRLFGVTHGMLFGNPLFGVGYLPESVATGDLDGDGDLDAIVTNGVHFEGDGNVSILLNLGNGNFADEVRYDTGSGAGQVAIADLDGDGDLDLAVVTGDVTIFLNHGDGTFADNVTYDSGHGTGSVAVGDLDGDGDLDLAIASELCCLSVLLNDGDGTFADSVFYEAGSRPPSVAIADLDGDGDLDLAVTNPNRGSVLVLLNGCVP